jgi:translation initiation factor IF-1
MNFENTEGRTHEVELDNGQKVKISEEAGVYLSAHIAEQMKTNATRFRA